MNTRNSIALTTDIKFLKGVGPRRASILHQENIYTIHDLIKYYPRKYLDRTNIQTISNLKIGEKAVFIAKVQAISMKKTKRGKYFQLTAIDNSGHYINCIWFNSISWIIDKFKKGDRVAFFGKIEFYQNLRVNHPEFDILDETDDPINTGCIIPLYPSNNSLKKVGLDSRCIRRLILRIFKDLDTNISDYFCIKFLKEEGLINLHQALYDIHIPNTEESIKRGIYRLKFNEHFFLQLLKALNKKQREMVSVRGYKELGIYARKIYKSLDFNLTNAQIKVLREIRQDVQSTHPMNRLIQGDVGCGKTIVAILAASIIVGNNAQVAIIAPTEILAEQHFKSFSSYFNNLDIKCELLIGNLTKKNKEKLCNNLKNKKIDIIIGTHALIQEDVYFHDLGLAIIDEQHKFGVEQRKKLIKKGKNPNILAMTATPIPRTLAFTIHGDMEISWIDEMPKDREKITTKIVEGKQLGNVYEKMKEAMNKGEYCYIVYPIISESEKIDAKDAESAYLRLKKNEFKNYSLGFLHGKMKKEEKDNLMHEFLNGKINCLISTTVVEVGIDNSKATIMVIENSERFGLTQLHQLRGRVGRGSKKSFCYLIQRKYTSSSYDRLKIMEHTSDGFKISEEDLKIRGPGDFFGTKQHGYIQLGLANFFSDSDIIKRARRKAFEIIDKDSKLIASENVLIKKEFLINYKDMFEFININ